MRDKNAQELKEMWKTKLLQKGIRKEEELEDVKVIKQNQNSKEWHLGFEAPVISMDVDVCGVRFCISCFAHCCGMFVVSNLSVSSVIPACYKLVKIK